MRYREVPALGLIMLLASGCYFDGFGVSSGGELGAPDLSSDGAPGLLDLQADGHGDGEPLTDGGPSFEGPISDGPRADVPLKDDGAPPDLLKVDTLKPDTTNPCADCPLGCVANGSRCKVLVPLTRTVLQTVAIDQAVTGDCVLTPASDQEFTIDSTAGTFPDCPKASVTMFGQSNGPGVTVIAFNTLQVGTKATLRITGTRAVMFYARRTISIEGTIDGSATLHTGGPGGKFGPVNADGQCWFTNGQGRQGSGSGNDDSGGGGGAWATIGAAGGTAGGQLGGEGGTGQGTATAPVPFIGGCSGGAGGRSNQAGRGGGGGGALHFVAGQSITISGTVNVGGGGGAGGINEMAGGGGGSGGMILLESQLVTTSGTLAANGGGGGSGAEDKAASASGKAGLPGEDGLASASTQAAGGLSVDNKSGYGGKGATQGSAATKGENQQNAGGGGGGLGRLHVRATNAAMSGARSPTQTVANTVNIQ